LDALRIPGRNLELRVVAFSPAFLKRAIDFARRERNPSCLISARTFGLRCERGPKKKQILTPPLAISSRKRVTRQSQIVRSALEQVVASLFNAKPTPKIGWVSSPESFFSHESLLWLRFKRERTSVFVRLVLKAVPRLPGQACAYSPEAFMLKIHRGGKKELASLVWAGKFFR